MGSSPRRSSAAGAPPPGRVVAALDRAVAAELPRLLPHQRWFGGKGRVITGASVADRARLGDRAWLVLVEVAFEHGPGATYAVPFVLREGGGTPSDASLELALDGSVRAADAWDDPEFCLTLLSAFERETSLPSDRGVIRFVTTDRFPRLVRPLPPRRLRGEQSHTSVTYGDLLILKALRRIEPGISLDHEVGVFLMRRAGFAHVPSVAGAIEYAPAVGPVTTLALLQHFVANRGDGWTYVCRRLERGSDPREPSDTMLEDLKVLGAVTGGLHAALASDPADPAFAPEPITPADTAAWTERIAGDVRRTCAMLHERLDVVPEPLKDEARAVVAGEAALLARVRDLDGLAVEGCAKLRIHGDYHLGQTLRTDLGFVILDFEGEPARPLAERRAKQCALVDVAGMLRSLDYAAGATLASEAPLGATGARWLRGATRAFLEGYLPEAARARARLVPRSGARLAGALAVFELDKALYEVRYEIDNRPTWLSIPVRGLGRLLARERGGS